MFFYFFILYDYFIFFFFFFFFKQKTAYEMSLRDWSSDVCSSDLCAATCASGPSVRSHGRPPQTRAQTLRAQAEPYPKERPKARPKACGQAHGARAHSGRAPAPAPRALRERSAIPGKAARVRPRLLRHKQRRGAGAPAQALRA